jgi:hypothetical protein
MLKILDLKKMAEKKENKYVENKADTVSVKKN